MSLVQVTELGRELLLTAVLLSLPAVVVSLLVGMVISVLQTITSIQEQTLSFAPRIIAVAVVLIAFLPWMLKTASLFTNRMFGLLLEVGP